MSLDDTEPGTPGTAAPATPPELRKITDARTLRALAHPVRMAILEELSLGSAMTATEVGEQIGESATTCSFHLRQLAKYGFVEETGGGKGRARPWRMVPMVVDIPNTHDDPETEIAATTLAHVVRQRQLDRYRTWEETKTSYPRPWRHAANSSQLVFYVTAEELVQLNDELLAFLRPRFLDRHDDPALRPPGAVPVEMVVFSYPLTLPSADGDDREETS